MKQYRGTTHRIWDPTEDATMNDEVLRSHEPRKRNLSNEIYNYAYAFVLDNVACLETWRL